MQLYETLITYFLTLLIIVVSYTNTNDELPTNWIDELYYFYDNHVNTNLVTSIVLSPLIFKPILFYLKLSFNLQNTLQKSLKSSNKYNNILVLCLRTIILFLSLFIFITIIQKMISIVFNFSNNSNVAHEAIIYLCICICLNFVFVQLIKMVIKRKNGFNK